MALKISDKLKEKLKAIAVALLSFFTRDKDKTDNTKPY